jgi:hypothetical protein
MHGFLMLQPESASLTFAISGPAATYILVIFGFLALLIIDILIALVQGVTLTLVKWSAFRTCLMVSLIMNVISGIINGVMLILLQRHPVIWLPISFVIAWLIDVFTLTYFRRDSLLKNSFYALLVNLVSYVLLILPAFYFGSLA